MDIQTILLEVLKKIVPKKKQVVAELNSSLIDDLGLDSLKLLYLSIELEQRANFDVLRAGEEVDFANIRTIRDLLELVKQYQKQI